MNQKSKTPLALAVGTAFVASLAAGSVAQAAPNSGNPFAMTEMSSGYMQVAAMKEGKCGEGKCGAGKMKNTKPMKDGKCGSMPNSKGMKDGKCGEGKCGSNKSGQSKDMKEGKCGGSK